MEKEFEMSVIELVDFKLIIVCIYRLPDGEFNIFKKKLEMVIQTIQSKKKRII
jgi:hypothetical protein